MFPFVKTPTYTTMASDRSTILLYPENIILIEHTNTPYGLRFKLISLFLMTRW